MGIPADEYNPSPARRKQRVRSGLISLALLGAVASAPSEWTLADIFRSAKPDGKVLISATRPPTAAATSVANSSTAKTSNTPGSNSSAESVVVKVATTVLESGRWIAAGN